MTCKWSNHSSITMYLVYLLSLYFLFILRLFSHVFWKTIIVNIRVKVWKNSSKRQLLAFDTRLKIETCLHGLWKFDRSVSIRKRKFTMQCFFFFFTYVGTYVHYKITNKFLFHRCLYVEHIASDIFFYFKLFYYYWYLAASKCYYYAII